MGLNQEINTLQSLFGLASADTQVEQPLCMECVKNLCEVFNTDLAEVDELIAAYKSSLEDLHSLNNTILSDEEFSKEMEEAQLKESKLKAEVEALEVELRQSEEELRLSLIHISEPTRPY